MAAGCRRAAGTPTHQWRHGVVELESRPGPAPGYEELHRVGTLEFFGPFRHRGSDSERTRTPALRRPERSREVTMSDTGDSFAR